MVWVPRSFHRMPAPFKRWVTSRLQPDSTGAGADLPAVGDIAWIVHAVLMVAKVLHLLSIDLAAFITPPLDVELFPLGQECRPIRVLELMAPGRGLRRGCRFVVRIQGFGQGRHVLAGVKEIQDRLGQGEVLCRKLFQTVPRIAERQLLLRVIPPDLGRLTTQGQPGIRKFCERYSVEWRPNPPNDPVAEELKKQWQHVGYGTELYGPNGWLYSPFPHNHQPKMNATLQLLCHPNRKPGDNRGDIYKLSFSGNRQGRFDVVGFIERTEGLHSGIVHILLMGPDISPIVTIPAIQGVDETAELIGKFVHSALDHQCANSIRELNREKLRWPEHIIWPGHMLTVFDESMKEPVLTLN